MSATTGFTSKLKVTGSKFNPDIASFDIAAADTEESYALPIGTVYFSVQNMGKTILRMAYIANETANNGNYVSIYPGVSRAVDGIGAGSVTIYLRAGNAQRVEIESWA